MGRMHADESEIDEDLVRGLVGDQHPALAELELRAVASTGTVNAVFRLGPDLSVRLPRVAAWADDLVKEVTWLPHLAPSLPLLVPRPVATGVPGRGYPYAWAVYEWIEGEEPRLEQLPDLEGAAEDLAGFVAALHAIDPADGPRSRRDAPLAARDADTRAAIDALGPTVDGAALVAAWGACLRAPPWDGQGVWTHGDLLPPNLLTARGRVTAVIDFGNVGIGDPALDVLPAWSVLEREPRARFREALSVDDGTWARARGYALHQAVLIMIYYPTTNPGFVAMASRTIAAILDDTDGAGS